MNLLLVDVSVVVWCVLSRGGYWVVWSVVLLCWLKHTVGWIHWPSAHQSINSVVATFACRMTPNSSLSFPYYMFLIFAWFCPDFNILSIVENVSCICRDRVIFYISYMFMMSYFYSSPSLTNIRFVTCFAI